MQETVFVKAAECLKIIAHPKRLQILAFLRGGRQSVGKIASFIAKPSHVTSEHLRLMLRCGFLKAEREGRMIYYVVCEKHVFDLLRCVEKRFGEENGKDSNKRIQKKVSTKRR